MAAARFVGRVGGLAMALGIGMAAFSAPTTWANTGSEDGASAQASGATANHSASRRAPSRAARGSASAAVPTANARNKSQARPTVDPSMPEIAGESGAPQPAAISAPAPAVPSARPGARPAAADVVVGPVAAAPEMLPVPDRLPAVVAEAPETTLAPEALPAPMDSVGGVVMAAADSGYDPSAAPGGLPATESPLSWALLAAARRQSLTASSIFDNHITANPTVAWGGLLGPDNAKTALPGVLVGAVNATSSKNLPMSFVVLRKPDAGGKIGGGPLLPLTNFYGSEGGFTYLPDSSTLSTPGATEDFTIMAIELTKFDQTIEKLFGGLGKLLVPQVLAIIHRIPLVGDLLSPLIGQAKAIDFTVMPNTLAAQRPTAFTYKMPSFDGTLISLNYFPATNVATDAADSAPTVLAASGLACAANTDPLTRYGQLFPANQFGSLTPGIAPLRDDYFKSTLPGGLEYSGGGGYNVVTWDPRGEFASGGQLNIDNPFLEGRDVSSIISWLTGDTNIARAQVKTSGEGDPLIGMTGGSYGGGIQLTTVDPRIDAITPEIGWNSLISSLYPGGAFKTGWATILAAALAVTGARVNPAIYLGILQGDLFGKLSPSSEAVLANVGPTVLLSKEQAPTMLFQGIDDTLFPLSESVANGQAIQTSPANPPLKLFWFCGGHGDCDIDNKPVEQDQYGIVQNLMWMDQYVAGSSTAATDKIRTFQWFDQKGLYYNSDTLPWDPAFNQGEYTATGEGGFLGLWPAGGGSGPYPIKDLPFSIVNAGKAWNAVNTAVTVPAGNQVVGAPTLSFTYSGLGTGHTVYAQLVDNTTGLVLSNITTPVQVKLDGKTHTVSIAMEDIAYTSDTGDSLTLQITSSSLNYANAWSYGWIRMSDINLDMPLHTKVAPVPFTT